MKEMDVILSEEELYYSLFSEVSGLGDKFFSGLMAMAGSVKAAFYLEDKHLESLGGSKGILKEFRVFRNELKRRFVSAECIEEWKREQLARLSEKGIRYFSRISPGFPSKLKHIPDPPIGIWLNGSVSELEAPMIAMIGARSCSGYGRKMASEFAEAFAAAGITIISGMARGIDGISQRSALLAGGKSIAVLGCGVDICYPGENRDIFEALPLSGGILSEYAPGTAPRSILFPRRNRLISGLGDVLMVVEARIQSGTSITVDMALEQGREVYVIPGRATDALSEGCNELLRQGAHPVTSPAQLLEELGYKKKGKRERKTLPPFEDSLQQVIYEALEENPVTIEELAAILETEGRDLDYLSLSRKLSHMVIEGWVIQPHSGFFARA